MVKNGKPFSKLWSRRFIAENYWVKKLKLEENIIKS